jgi:hypothetical protein
MKCQLCLKGEKATYRAYTDAMEMKVCSPCAAEAPSLRIAVETLAPAPSEQIAGKTDAGRARAATSSAS